MYFIVYWVEISVLLLLQVEVRFIPEKKELNRYSYKQPVFLSETEVYG